MPWPVRSTRFAAIHATPAANTSTFLATVPTGKKWLVKDWSAFNQGAATRNLYLQVKVGAVTYVVDAALNVATGNPTGNANRHLVLNAGESLYYQSSTAQLLDLQVSGAELG